MTSPRNLWLRLEFDFDDTDRLITKIFEGVSVSRTPDYIACVVPHLAAFPLGKVLFSSTSVRYTTTLVAWECIGTFSCGAW